MKHKRIYKKRKLKAFFVLFILAFCALVLSKLDLSQKLGISALIIAICLGAVVGNFFPKLALLLQKTALLNLATKQILRLGIILYGFKITLVDIKHLGLSGIMLAFCIVFLTFFIALGLGKMFKIATKESLLIAAGSSICGAAAVLASQSIVKAETQKVAVAICTVVVFGTLMMFIYPLLYHFGVFKLDEGQMGYLMGASLHEVAHAIAAGAGVGDLAKNNAVIMKMMRVLMLVPFLLFLALLCAKLFKENQGSKFSIKANFPYFALYFLLAIFISSLPFLNTEFSLFYIKPNIELIDTFLLSFAMVALGVNIRKDMLKNAGFKPFFVASLLCIWLFIASFIGVRLLF